MHYSKEKLSIEERRYIDFIAYYSLIEFDADLLPVISASEQKLGTSIFIVSMCGLCKRWNLPDNYFVDDGDGAVLYCEKSDHYLLIYNDKAPTPTIRWVIAKLLYLVVSGIAKNEPSTLFSIDYSDPRGDAFAYQFTCPNIILNECAIESVSDIIRYCQIPVHQAMFKSSLLLKYAPVKAFKTIEDIIKKNFDSFIRYIKNGNDA